MCDIQPQKKTKLNSHFGDLDSFYQQWEGGRLTTAITIEGADFSVNNPPITLPQLECDSITINNCQNVTALGIRFIIQSFDFKQMKNLTINFQEDSSDNIETISEIATIISETISISGHVAKLFAKSNFTFQCSNSKGEIERPIEYALKRCAEKFSIIIDDTTIEPHAARSVA
jgi:hypothetical protein